MAVINLSNDAFEKEVVNSDVPVLIDFYATWCAPCRAVSPVVDKIAEENENIKVCKVNVDEQSELAAKFGIASIPTLIVFKNGNIHRSGVGVKSKAEILELFE